MTDEHIELFGFLAIRALLRPDSRYWRRSAEWARRRFNRRAKV